jgi:hypothetical protein
MDLKEIIFKVRTELICYRIYLIYVVGCCKYGNERSGSIKCGDFLG